MAPILRFIISSGSKKKEHRYACVSEVKASHLHKMWTEVFSFTSTSSYLVWHPEGRRLPFPRCWMVSIPSPAPWHLIYLCWVLGGPHWVPPCVHKPSNGWCPVPGSAMVYVKQLLQQVASAVWHISLLYTQLWAPDDGRKDHPKHVERFTRINNLR
jgi:hypothetical protein